jgi:UDP-N-acetylmuramate dehydrogenase
MTSWADLVAVGIARRGVPLHTLTTYKLGGPAAILVEPEHVDHLEAITAAFQDQPLPVLLVGRGSNLVIADTGFPGVAIHLGRGFGAIDVAEHVTAGAAAGLPQVARATTKEGRLGLEFMIGIPGSMGGAVRQNAGCFGQEIASVLVEARIFDLALGNLIHADNAYLDFSYRHSSVLPTQIVIDARFATYAGRPEIGEARIREITRWRRLNQPGGTLNAGSVFKNPFGDTAGRIIDSLGLKGLRVGSAAVSEKHANFFVAMPGTRAVDVYLLVQEVARRVKEATGIVLEPEIQFAGDFEEAAVG